MWHGSRSRGADVLGIDSSEEMVRTARERFGEAAEFRREDLEEPLSFIDDGTFDVVSSQLTLSHLSDWQPTLREFKRVLSTDGVLVVSTDHPFRQFLLADRDEFSDIDPYAADSEPKSAHEPIRRTTSRPNSMIWHTGPMVPTSSRSTDARSATTCKPSLIRDLASIEHWNPL